MDPDDAFAVSAQPADDRSIELRFRIAPGHYLYRDRISWAAQSATLGSAELPSGQVKYDSNFQKSLETYRGELRVRLPVKRAAARFTLDIGWQGCADEGLCYAPMTRSLQVGLAGFGGDGSVQPGSAADEAPAKAPGSAEQLLASGRFGWVVAGFFVMGVLLSLTPCVLPMLPILSSIIVGSGTATRTRGLTLAASYSLGMALVYTAAGVAAGLAGEGLAAHLQQPWILLSFGLLLTVFALALLGSFELQLPAGWTAGLHAAAGRLPGGRAAGVFAMGALSALVVSPCVSAPLAGALVFIGRTHDVALGGSALFALAAGMSVPLLLLGASAGALLPRAGPWMVSVKRLFAVLLLALAVWTVQPALGASAGVAAWGALLLVVGFMLNPFDPPRPEHPAQPFRRAAGFAALVLGSLQLVGAGAGATDPLRPLAALRDAPISAANASPALRNVAGPDELDTMLRSAGRPVVLTFHADWCVSCKELEHTVYADPQIAARLPRALTLGADVTANAPAQRALMRRFGLYGPPGVVFFDAAGRERADLRMIGLHSAQEFARALDQMGL
ncbi:protein-disulfide reductase DsbD [Rhizobacter sp. AJA081-3]|uniref:protein-disulfide reductase DsbD n=1 Tax=Rhizobacter sp. AJA081-3 TaxID=2753607 RepID=UPI001FD7E173|nr:protein-disulfide reductase DsbD [Rhizobacter sp. AJA081-3]